MIAPATACGSTSYSPRSMRSLRSGSIVIGTNLYRLRRKASSTLVAQLSSGDRGGGWLAPGGCSTYRLSVTRIAAQVALNRTLVQAVHLRIADCVPPSIPGPACPPGPNTDGSSSLTTAAGGSYSCARALTIAATDAVIPSSTQPSSAVGTPTAPPVTRSDRYHRPCSGSSPRRTR